VQFIFGDTGRVLRYLNILLLVIFIPVDAQGETTDAIRMFGEPSYSLNLHMDVFTDITGRLTLEDIQQLQYQKQFVRNSESIINLGMTDNQHWVRFHLSNSGIKESSDEIETWYLEIGRALLDVAVLYTPLSDGGYTATTSDLSVPFSKREIRHVNSIFPVSMAAGDEGVFYLKVKHATVLLLPLTLWTPQAFVEKVASEEFYYGIYFGVLLALIVFNTFIYLQSMDKLYLYYISYIICLGWFQLTEVGHGLIHSDLLFLLEKDDVVIAIWTTTGFAILFFREYLLNKKTNPIISYIVNVILWIILLSILISSVMGKYLAVYWASIFSIIFLTFILMASFILLLNGNKNARYFLLGWVCNTTGFIIYSLVANDVIVVNLFTVHFIEVGVLFELTFLSLAMADKINRSRKLTLTLNNESIARMESYTAIFNNCQHGKYQMNLEGVILEVNAAAATTLGYSSINAVLSNKQAVARQLYSSSINAMQSIVSNRDTSQEFYTVLEDGYTQRWFLHTSRQVNDNNSGRPSYIDGNIIDITEEKKRDLSKQQELKERVDKELAVIASNHKSQFLSVMSTHIRVPLTAIVGYSELLKDGDVSQQEKSFYTDIILKNSQRLLSLINDILDYSKITAGKLDIECTPVNLGILIEEIATENRQKAMSKSITFVVDYECPIPEIFMTDATRVRQGLQILCDNALKFTRKGGVTLRVSYINGVLIFLVSDTGKGIKKHRINTLLDQNGLVERGSFGLAILKSFALQMGGSLTFTTEQNKGSDFTFSVPVTSQKKLMMEKTQHSDVDAIKNATPSDIPVLKGTVLVAEDNLVNQKIIAKVIEKTGVTVIVVEDGVEACEYCDTHNVNATLPDLVLMDINMPRRNGLEATEYLRHKKYDIPIYALTAETAKSEINKVMDAGCDGFLSKPLEKKKLYAILTLILSDGIST